MMRACARAPQSINPLMFCSYLRRQREFCAHAKFVAPPSLSAASKAANVVPTHYFPDLVATTILFGTAAVALVMRNGQDLQDLRTSDRVADGGEALVLLPEALETSGDAPCEAFNGTWVYDRARSDSPVPQLKALGVRWLMRQAAGIAKPIVTVNTQNSGVWNEHICAGKVFQMDESLALDGSWASKRKQGHQVVESTTVEDEGNCVVTHIKYCDGASRGATTEIRRYILNSEEGRPLLYHVHNKLTLQNGRIITRDSYFTRKAGVM